MFYSILFLTALLSQLQGSGAVPTVSTQTRAKSGSVRPSIAALNNLVVIGDAGGTSGVGDISFSTFTYVVDSSNAITGGEYVQALSGTTANTVQTSASGDLAFTADKAGNTFTGLGHDVAIADMSTVFVSQSSQAKQTGRVIVYEGNVTSFSQSQILSPHDGAHDLSSDAFFGESISARRDALAVGCQNCNSSAPIYSGAVYVYKPNKEGRWSEAQTLTSDGILFLGERVALHEKVLVAAGDDSSTYAQSASHIHDNVANSVVVFEEVHDHFEQRQVIAVKSGAVRESITSLTVYDETIAITTMGASAASPDKVFIYYPTNSRYGLATEHKPKAKPHPQQWTNTQILTVLASTRYSVGSPSTSISMNTLMYLTTDGTDTAQARAVRDCLSCAFSTPVMTALALDDAVNTVLLTADSNSFYTSDTVTAATLDKPFSNSMTDNCLTLSLQDQYKDGWGIASLVVTDPSGHEDKYTLQCQSANPQVFKYCPRSLSPGKYSLHIENGEETPFGWEIVWKVAAGSSWYYGDKHTHMDFLWDEKYNDFHVGATKGLLPLVPTCTVCSATKPEHHDHHHHRRGLSNLRALHHKGATRAPTNTFPPTIVATGYGSLDWHVFAMNAAVWFDADYNGDYWWITNADGSKLIHQGTPSCSTTATECWVELPDGDYRVRAGASINTPTNTWTFCGATNDQAMDTEFFFTVLDDQCYPTTSRSAENTCLNTYLSDFFLDIDVVVNGVSDMLSTSDKSAMKVAMSETMLSVLGSVPASIRLGKQEVTYNGLKVSFLVQFNAVPDSTSLNNFVLETASASSLLKYELVGTQELAANFLKGAVSELSIVSVSTDANAHDFSKVDESSFQTITDHYVKTATVEQTSSDFNMYAKYVAEGAYALVAVAAVLAVSLFAKRALSKTEVVEDVAGQA